LRPFIDAWLEPLQNPHVTDDAIAVDDALNDDSPLDLCPHRIRRVLGAHLVDEDRQLHIRVMAGLKACTASHAAPATSAGSSLIVIRCATRFPSSRQRRATRGWPRTGARSGAQAI
jgi:hypothetical protein